MQKLGIYNKAPSKKKEYEPKLYQQMTYPGERVQIDMKYVPAKNLTEEVKEIDGDITNTQQQMNILEKEYYGQVKSKVQVHQQNF